MNVRNGIYIDFLRCFLYRSKRNHLVWIFDGGLSDIYDHQQSDKVNQPKHHYLERTQSKKPITDTKSPEKEYNDYKDILEVLDK